MMKDTLAEELQDRLAQTRTALQNAGVLGRVQVQVYLGAWGITLNLEMIITSDPR